MGVLRLYLAICVVAIHSGKIVPWDLHNGREAVQIFFIISGFYMQLIITCGKYQSIFQFYRARILRIFIPYFFALGFVVTTSIIWGCIFGDWLTLREAVLSGSNKTTGAFLTLITNFTVFFQDWVFFFAQTKGESLHLTVNYNTSEFPLWRYLWIPQAWSIGVELSFYLIAPFLIKKISNRNLIIFVVAVFAARLVLYKMIGFIGDPWIYRFFPFELAHFFYGLLGARLIQRFESGFARITTFADQVFQRMGKLSYVVFPLSFLAGFWGQRSLNEIGSHYAKKIVPSGGIEIFYLLSLSEWIIIVPILFAATKHITFDRTLGELSFPIYLTHYTVAMAVHEALRKFDAPLLAGPVAVILSVILAVLFHFAFFQKFELWRQRYITRKNAGL